MIFLEVEVEVLLFVAGRGGFGGCEVKNFVTFFGYLFGVGLGDVVDILVEVK